MGRLGNQGTVMLALGVLVVVLAIILAVTIRFGHFYEVLLLGQFIALCSLPGSRLYRQAYTRLYLVFIGSGVIADLVMGRYIGRFWRYDHFGPADYAVLYAFTYPVAGIVMVQSFLAARDLLPKMKGRPGRSRALSARHYAAVIALLAPALAGTFVEGVVSHNQNLMALAYILAVLLASLVMSLVTALNNHRTLIDDVHGRSLGMLAAFFAAAYFNAFLHEIPNTFAHEWTYTNYPWPAVHIFSIPVLILIGWPLLLVFPLSVYYWVRSLPPSF